MYYSIIIDFIDLVTLMAENIHKVNQHTNSYTNSEPTAPSIETVNFVFEQLRSTMRTVMDPVFLFHLYINLKINRA